MGELFDGGSLLADSGACRIPHQPWFLFLGSFVAALPLIQAPAERAKTYLMDVLISRGWDVLREERFDRMKRIGTRSAADVGS